jgi:hypothetical protein
MSTTSQKSLYINFINDNFIKVYIKNVKNRDISWILIKANVRSDMQKTNKKKRFASIIYRKF